MPRARKRLVRPNAARLVRQLRVRQRSTLLHHLVPVAVHPRRRQQLVLDLGKEAPHTHVIQPCGLVEWVLQPTDTLYSPTMATLMKMARQTAKAMLALSGG